MDAALARFARFALVRLAGSLVYFAVQLAAIGAVVTCNFVGAQRIFQARRTFSYGKDTA
ncbi:hypothetical protein [Massilia niabensis]|uniref:Uncharacterized protein n=1 Tax=Massilia niabensis TaxID=544910 RepID=A0ABW0L200_9BURK